jgi:acetyl-CoA carboxylase carboxyl transferase subunit beta
MSALRARLHSYSTVGAGVAHDTSVVPATGAALPIVKLPERCPACRAEARSDLLRSRLYVCECLHHFVLSADAWIALLADPESWCERWTELVPADVLQWMSPIPYRETLQRAQAGGLNEAVRAGSCELDGICVWLAVFDFRFMGGSLGMVSGERLARAMEAAIDSRRPFLLVTASGGARMQEGLLALMQMPKVNAVLANLHDSGIVFVSLLTHPTYGGTAASLALQADVNVAEPGAAIGFSGPRVIRQATFASLPDNFQNADFQRDHGQVDLIVPRWELRQRLAQLLSLYTPWT